MRLAIEPDLMVIGEAGDGETAVALALELRPDIVLMDVELPRLDGLSATRAIRELAPEIAVVMLTLHSDRATRAQAEAAGAAAFVDKSAGEVVLLAALRDVVHPDGRHESS